MRADPDVCHTPCPSIGCEPIGSSAQVLDEECDCGLEGGGRVCANEAVITTSDELEAYWCADALEGGGQTFTVPRGNDGVLRAV